MKQFKDYEAAEPIPAPTLKEGNQNKFMFRGLTILNTVESRNIKKRLPDMNKIGGGTPITKRKENYMEYK